MASAVSNLSSLKLVGGNARFNAEAASWDSRPFVHKASKHAAEAITSSLASDPLTIPTTKITNLEIGCGTGILSFLLAPHFKHVVAIDAAAGMIEVLKTKLANPGAPRNITPVAVLLEDPNDEALPAAADEVGGGRGRMKFDLVTSHLVLHHIPELESVLRTMYGCLKPGGRVLLTDFMAFHGGDGKIESGSRRFHPESKMEGVARHGIEPKEMEMLMEAAGFCNVSVSIGWRIQKMVEGKDGQLEEQMEFPFVLCRGDRAMAAGEI